MKHRKVGNNRVLRKDESGTYYKDIVFVPSGSLSINNPTASTSSTRSREEDVNEIREFYKSVLAMPKTESQPVRRRKRNILKQVSKPTKSSPPSGTVTSNPTALPGSMSNSASVKSDCATTAANRTIKHYFTPTRIKHSLKYIDKTNTTEQTSNVGRNLRKDDLDRHRRGTAHLMSQELPVKPIDTLTLGHENKGFRMLVNSGWEYEKGLGAEGQGARHPVATRLKHDRLALGAAGTSKKLVTHTFEEIEKSRAKPIAKSDRRVPLNADDYRKKAEKERRDRVRMMIYMKK
ncbi:G patch domain and ankyrin repeat-containing protein 1 [Linnemannia elongata]|nr:G patch domain and ankyrin repeat-containing protein 1 [Linnemannia elongata]